jgi:hypothetical protein
MTAADISAATGKNTNSDAGFKTVRLLGKWNDDRAV